MNRHSFVHAAPFALAFLVPASLVLALYGGGAWSFATVVFVFGVVPVADAWGGVSRANPAPDDEDALASNPWYRALTIAWVPVHLVLLVLVVGRLARGPVSAVEAAGLVLSLGIVGGGGGITVAHELMHRPGRLERALAEVLLLAVNYPWFTIEHLLGHHRHVATPRDPATARHGESVYAFIPRSVLGGLASALRLEAARVRRRGARAWSWRNRFWRYAAELAAIYAAVGLLAGTRGVLVFAVQGVIAFSLLEVINYVEHYGLVRAETAPDRYERTRLVHSWNSSHRVGNWFLFNLQRHSDHHYLAARPYQVLRHFDESPQLPSGYAAMVPAALVPPLWHRLMEPRLARWREQREAERRVA